MSVETPLSNFEIRLDNSYRPRQDPAITVGFTLVGESKPTRLLVWTTTPWTLPSNLEIAAGASIEYAILEKDGQRLVLGAATAGKYGRSSRAMSAWARSPARSWSAGPMSRGGHR